MTKLIFGLGNPGKNYLRTRHNVGQQVIHALVKRLGLKLTPTPKFISETTETSGTIIGLSTDFMNLSGNSVSKLAGFYKTDPQNIYIIHDELDFKVGEWKVQFDRSAAGHNGIKSIIDRLGTQAFNRIRIGIDHPRNSNIPQLPVEEYVLKSFTSEEKVIIDNVVDKIVSELTTLINEG